jgi:urease accessory protein
MRKAVEMRSARRGTGHTVVATVTLRFDERHRRRFMMTDDNGDDFLLDLPRAALLADGDRLILEKGGAIVVRAAPECVADFHTNGAAASARLAWHIGNRHTPIQVLPNGALRVLDDHVLVDLAERHGAWVRRHVAPFAPEPGAYAEGHDSAHSHSHGHNQVSQKALAHHHGH